MWGSINLDVESFVLQCHLKDPCDLASELNLPGVDITVKAHDTLTDPRLELQDA